MEEHEKPEEIPAAPDRNLWDIEALLQDATPTWRLLPPPQVVETTASPIVEPPAERSVAGTLNGPRRARSSGNPFAISDDERIAGGYQPFTGESTWRLGPVEESVREWEYRPAEPAEPVPAPSTNWKAIVQEIAETAILTLLIFVMMRALIQNYRIEGYSMEPNLFERQYLIVNKVAYYFGEPQRGDIIVFEFPNTDPTAEERDYIKRIIGLPGDTVECEPNRIVVNGQAIDEPYGPNPWNYSCAPTTLGPDEYWVLGDNRPRSSDSHSWGPLERKYIIGKAWLLYWPLEDMGWVPNYPIEAPDPGSPVVQRN